MIMSCIKKLYFWAFILVMPWCFAQHNFETFGETGLVFNKKFSNSFKMNYALRTRYFLYKEQDFFLENRQIDLVTFSTFNLNYNKSLSLGVQYRFRENFDGASNELRLTQQYNFIKKNLFWRFGHRFRLEQRIFTNNAIFRQRYRFTVDRPLNGEQLDVGEAYIILSMEGLLSLTTLSAPEIDHRTTTQLGFQLTERTKIQLGFEYRFEKFNINTEEKLFILTGLIYKL
mgnify:CR=1 FL=1